MTITAVAAITTPRQLVYDIVTDLNVWPVWQWLPGDAEELPCYVVGRPDVGEGELPALASVTVPVYALGRTLRDDEAQAELDAAADALLTAFWNPKSPEPSMSIRLNTLVASVIPIAATEYPAYSASVVVTVAFC